MTPNEFCIFGRYEPVGYNRSSILVYNRDVITGMIRMHYTDAPELRLVLQEHFAAVQTSVYFSATCYGKYADTLDFVASNSVRMMMGCAWLDVKQVTCVDMESTLVLDERDSCLVNAIDSNSRPIVFGGMLLDRRTSHQTDSSHHWPISVKQDLSLPPNHLNSPLCVYAIGCIFDEDGKVIDVGSNIALGEVPEGAVAGVPYFGRGFYTTTITDDINTINVNPSNPFSGPSGISPLFSSSKSPGCSNITLFPSSLKPIIESV